MPDSQLVISRDLNSLPSMRSSSDLAILPSTLIDTDPILNSIISVRRETGIRTNAILPHWRGPFQRLRMPGSGDLVRLHRDLAQAETSMIFVNLDLVGGKGPFALDLVSHFLSPIDRAKMLSSRDRSTRVAKANLVVRIDSVLITKKDDGGRIWFETSDLIVAELVCLALSESKLDTSAEYPSPWEEDLVQRATELDLGARYPGDIKVNVIGPSGDTALHAILSTLRLRLGIDISPISDQYLQNL